MAYGFGYPSYMSNFGPQQPFGAQMNISPQMPVQPPQSAAMQQTGAGAQSGFVCRPVTSRAEVDAFQIPFDGSTTYFVDTSNGKIYAKTFNFSNGTAPVVTYIRETDAPMPQYATIEDLNALREELTKTRKVAKKHDDADE